MMKEKDTDKAEDSKQLQWLNAMEYQAKFLLTPDLRYSEVDYSHIDKNLAIADLQYNPKIGVNEPEQVRTYLRALHVLNNPAYFRLETEKVFLGYQKEEQEDGSILQVPVFREQLVPKPVFKKSYHKLRSKVISFSNTAASRGGHRMKAAITNRLQKEQSIIDKTEHKSGFMGFGRSKNYNYDRRYR